MVPDHRLPSWQCGFLARYEFMALSRCSIDARSIDSGNFLAAGVFVNDLLERLLDSRFRFLETARFSIPNGRPRHATKSTD